MKRLCLLGGLALAACSDTDRITDPSLATERAAETSSAGPGAVYVLTNQPTNEVAVFHRAADGALAVAGRVATGGAGTGNLLDSQGALILSANGRWLFGVNAQSDEISVFSAGPAGLNLVENVPSGGNRPVSLTVSDDLLYVLNSGDAGNITGFRVGGGGRLTPIAGSTQPLSTAETQPCNAAPLSREAGTDCNVVSPGQIQFSPRGDAIVVTERLTFVGGVRQGQFLIYPVGRDGAAGGATIQPSSGQTPFGFAFGKRDRMFVSEAFLDLGGQGAASSYQLTGRGTLGLITGTLRNQQTASCWLVVSHDGRFAYTANPVAGSLTGYTIDQRGALSLLDADGSTADNVGDPRDMAMSAGGRYLYALNNRGQSVAAFRAASDGSLASLGSFGGTPFQAVGIAAR